MKSIETSMEADSIAKEHLAILKKMVMDSNVMAQGKGIAAGNDRSTDTCSATSDPLQQISSPYGDGATLCFRCNVS